MMEVIIAVCVVITGIVTVTYFVTKKNVKKHSTELTFGNMFQFKMETEFNKED